MKELEWQSKVQGIINTRNHPREPNKNRKSEMGSNKLLSQTRGQEICGYSPFSIPKFRQKIKKILADLLAEYHVGLSFYMTDYSTRLVLQNNMHHKI